MRAASNDFRNERWKIFVELLSTEDNAISKAGSLNLSSRIYILVINSSNGMIYTLKLKRLNLLLKVVKVDSHLIELKIGRRASIRTLEGNYCVGEHTLTPTNLSECLKYI